MLHRSAAFQSGTAAAVGHIFGFAGSQQSGTDNSLYLRNRTLDPSTGRFNEPDPIGLLAGDINFYRYVGNDPVGRIDPLGLQEQVPFAVKPVGVPLQRHSPGSIDADRFACTLERNPVIRSCIVCHNPIVMGGGSVRDLPENFQRGILEALKVTDTNAADRQIGTLQTLAATSRAGGTGVAIIASAPVSVPVSTAVVVTSAGIEVAVTGDESHAIDAIPGAGLRRLPGNVRTITNPDASPVERAFAGVDSVSSVLEAIPVFKAFKGLHGKTSNLRATPTTKPPTPESVTSKPTTPVEQADLQSSPQSSKICDSADVETELPTPRYSPVDSIGNKLSLPRTNHGNLAPTVEYPHTQIGWREGRRGGYHQTREFGQGGLPIKDVDWTDHGRPGNHTNPHVHDFIIDPKGGTPGHGPARPPRPGELGGGA